MVLHFKDRSGVLCAEKSVLKVSFVVSLVLKFDSRIRLQVGSLGSYTQGIVVMDLNAWHLSLISSQGQCMVRTHQLVLRPVALQLFFGESPLDVISSFFTDKLVSTGHRSGILQVDLDRLLQQVLLRRGRAPVVHELVLSVDPVRVDRGTRVA